MLIVLKMLVVLRTYQIQTNVKTVALILILFNKIFL